MTALNLSVSQRKIDNFEANSSNGTVTLKGEYKFTVSNNGILPTGKVNLRLKEVVVTDRDILLLSDENKSVGRFSPLSSQTVTVEFNEEFNTSDVTGVVRSICENKTVSLSTSMTLNGRIFNITASSTGVYNVMSVDCSLPSQEPEPEPEPPDTSPEPPDSSPEPPQDGGSNEPPEDDSRISGPNIMTVNSTEQYTWSDFDESTVTFNWALLSEREDPDPNNTELSLASEDVSDGITLDMTANVQGDFLIVIEAYGQNQELVDSAQKVVSVIPEQ